MKLTAKIKLVTTPAQRSTLLETLERANEAANHISHVAWEAQVFRQFPLHKLVYQTTRERFDLGAQMTVRCIAKVADAYKADRKTRRTFRKRGAVAYDIRILSYKASQRVSIWTLTGRLTLSYQAGQRQLELLGYQQGESDLVFIKGAFYLLATCDIPDPTQKQIDGYLGVDLGIEVIAADSDGVMHSGAGVKEVRKRYQKKRSELQRKGTKSARRLLNKRGGKESRFQKHVNHEIAKRIVAKAERTNRAVVLEDLRGIRERVKGFRPQRAMLHGWAFRDLQAKIGYKATMAGVLVVMVDAAFTSQTCPACGKVGRGNRRNRDSFVCRRCGFCGHADVVAAVNIAAKGSVNMPDAGVS